MEELSVAGLKVKSNSGALSAVKGGSNEIGLCYPFRALEITGTAYPGRHSSDSL